MSRRVRDELARRGLLLQVDARLASVASLVAREPIRGSWWAHPRARAIHSACLELEGDAGEVLVVKLVAGKVTYVHRSLWTSLLAVAESGERWQREGLSAAARALEGRVRRLGAVRTTGAAARELERYLAVHAEEQHTASGAHAKLLESWARWRERVGFVERGLALDQAKERLEEAVRALGAPAGARPRGRLVPWPARVTSPV